MDLREIQSRLDARYGALDRRSGAAFLMLVLQEEVGELAEAVRKGDRAEAGKEAADVLFAALAVANVVGADAEALLTAKFLDRPDAEVTRSWTDVPGGPPERSGRATESPQGRSGTRREHGPSERGTERGRYR